jgi:lysophospholipase L1-like esterase
MNCRSLVSAWVLAAVCGALLSGCGQSSNSDGSPNVSGAAGAVSTATGGASSVTGGQPGASAGQPGASAGQPGATGGQLGVAGAPLTADGGSGAAGRAPDSGTGGDRAAGGGSAGSQASAGAGAAGRSSAGSGGTSTGGGGTAKITLWLAGDSTMADGGANCPVGWGKQFQAYFNANAKVTNNAVGGTTVRSWLYNETDTLGADGECTLTSPAPQAHWTEIVNGMKAGDYLFVQFGINDTTAATCPKHVSLATFKQLFGMMAQAAKDKGATPIFLTSVSSISCTGTTAIGTRGTFATATKEAATQYGVTLIDLEQLSVALYTASGFCPNTDTAASFTANTPVGNFFCNDHTHFEAAGATKIAGVVAKAIKDQGIPLASYLLP